VTRCENWLVNREPTWEAAKKMIRPNPKYIEMAEEYKTSTMSTSSTRDEPTDKNMDNLARSFFGSQQAYSPMEIYARQTCQDKLHFDMQPTDPQNDIKGTGNCEQTSRSYQTTSSARDNT
jgi:hypothetical protein